MFGYILAAIIGILALGFALSSLGGGSPPSRQKSSSTDRKPKPIQQDEPSADEPTPDRSLVASSHEVEAAKRRTPPA